jgi:L-threonylcarbamoyladenylate synthase
VEDYFGEIVPVVVDGGNCKRGLESTIIGFDDDKVILYRLGALSIESIESVVGEIVVLNENNKNPDAPGMLSKHYSPSKRLILTSNMTETIYENLDKQIGVLSLDSQFESNTILHSEVLSKDGNLIAAASKLYAALHRLDMASIDLIIAERMPDIGIGRTMNDRLVRAANNERD